MNSFNDPYNRQSLIKTLRETQEEVADTFRLLALDDFYGHASGGWSPAETLSHLIKSGRNLKKSMRRPKIVLRLLYGNNRKPSRQYHQMRESYQAELIRGYRAENGQGTLVPDKIDPPTSQREAENKKTKLLHEWRDLSSNLLQCVESWHEMHLEAYRLRHPALDLITVREMLMLTIYHDLYHLHKIQQAHPKKRSRSR